MRYSTLIFLFASTALASQCAAPAPSCLACKDDAPVSKSCVAKIASCGTVRSTCTSSATAATPTITITKKAHVQSTRTKTVVSTVLVTDTPQGYGEPAPDPYANPEAYGQPAPAEYGPAPVTSTTTVTETSRITSEAVITASNIITEYSTTTVTSTTSLPAPNYRLGRVRAVKREAVPAICSCFLTTTSLITCTPAPTTKTTTIKKTRYQTATSTVVTTSTVQPTAAPSTVLETVTVSSIETAYVSRTTTLDSTTTVATTVTAWETIYPTPDISCNNEGLAFAINTHQFYNSDYEYTSFDPTVFKSQQPNPSPEDGSGTTNFIGGIYNGSPSNAEANDPISIYGKPQRQTTYLAVNHRGYIYARESGTYVFSAPAVDDITFLWTGPKAVSGWTRQNADIVQNYIENGWNWETSAPAKEFSVNLEVGQYLPFRIVWGNGQTRAKFDFQIKAPNGELIIGANTGPSPYLVQFSCGSDLAPAFPAFGAES